MLRLRGTQGQSTGDGGLQLADRNVQMDVLVLRNFRPGRWNITATCINVSMGPAPERATTPRSGVANASSAQEPAVEGRQLIGIRAVEQD